MRCPFRRKRCWRNMYGSMQWGIHDPRPVLSRNQRYVHRLEWSSHPATAACGRHCYRRVVHQQPVSLRQYLIFHPSINLQTKSVDTLPQWNFDGSSTDQAPGDDSEVIMYPQAIFKDPFRPSGDNILVMCDCYTPAGDPIETNTRAPAAKICT